MKRIFISLSLCACALALNAQDVMVCNFDDVFPDVSAWGTMTFTTAPAPAGVLASKTMGVLTVVAGNQAGSLVIQMDNTFNPQDYVG
ncbi:MAG: hypothetical protein FWF52_07320, partial [Candidatus Azobacteroides sp.]|nr:hypothetical protein [Candidatus Azobacteroides sp.]